MDKKDGPKSRFPVKVRLSEAACSLEYKKPYELLIAVRLSAQCTDKRVNMVTPVLFKRYPTQKAWRMPIRMKSAKLSRAADYIKRNPGHRQHC
jgi:endonuclease-3